MASVILLLYRQELGSNLINKISVKICGEIIFRRFLFAVSNQDIVYVNLEGNLELMSKNIVKAMQEEGVKRIIAISSIGIYDQPLKPVLVPYRKLADVIENSGLDYTILRPDWFTNADEIDYSVTIKGTPETGSAISRKSIADFVSKLFIYPNLYVNENLGISKT